MYTVLWSTVRVWPGNDFPQCWSRYSTSSELSSCGVAKIQLETSTRTSALVDLSGHPVLAWTLRIHSDAALSVSSETGNRPVSSISRTSSVCLTGAPPGAASRRDGR